MITFGLKLIKWGLVFAGIGFVIASVIAMPIVAILVAIGFVTIKVVKG